MTHDTIIPQGYKATALGIIPQEWEIKYICDVGIVKTGSTPSTKDKSNFGLDYMFVTPADISDEKYITDTERKLSYKGFSISRKIPQGSILFTCIGIIGKIAIASNDLTSNQQINAIICNDIHNEYLYYELLGRRNIIKSLAGEQVLPMIKKSDFEKIKIIVPPVEEQRKIAEILGVWDKAIELQVRIIDKLELRKRALMQRLLSGRHRLPSFSAPWQKAKLGDICKIATGSLNANAMCDNGVYPFFTCAKEVYKINEYAFDTEALLISGNGEYVGYIHYCKGRFNAYQRTYVLDKFVSNIFFLKYILQYYLPKRILQAKSSSNTPYIVMDTLTDMELIMPDIDEQSSIANILLTADQEIELAKAKLAAYRSQKRGLMQQLLTGKKRVK